MMPAETTLLMPTIVILSPALGGTKDLEILRLPPQNDVVGQPLWGILK
jgi:hypothetical protein